MGKFNSSKTRVQPVLGALLREDRTGASWLPALWGMARSSRRSAVEIGADVGELTPSGRVFERSVPPPTLFLQWLLQHPEVMSVGDDQRYGSKNPAAIAKRRALFSTDPIAKNAAIKEGLLDLSRYGPTRSARKWWAFEGFTAVDCCLETPTLILFIEGKRTELLSPSTKWFPQRNQLWRNVETAEQLGRDKQFGVLLAVESDEAGRKAVSEAQRTLAQSLPHRSEHQALLARHFLGYVTWRKIQREFDLPPECLVKSC